MTYRADRDPLIAAGWLRCGRCGRVAYPVDAVWVGARLVVAWFPAVCEHADPVGWLVDLDAPCDPSPWCGQLTRAGDPCRNRAPAPGRPCHVHDPGRRELWQGRRQGRVR